MAAYASGRRLHDEAVAALEPVPHGRTWSRPGRSWPRPCASSPPSRPTSSDVVTATRKDEAVQIGAGPRASLALLDCARARAALAGRDFATPDDVKQVARPVLDHRVTLQPEAEMEGTTLEDVLRRIFEATEVPR